ncbi:MAG: hypothetical protein GEV28_03485 [Actinophytocola sp.]|uniref:hypothetical protein n=1 Tax=Actinophytocola sp. TaxID=1872138 RepID=UPI00132A73AD|nr:hypothetical protein [Actinophytocola sp.]MPZ79497.1 hypothetical protein [Actinophytocola sp.]
MNEQDFRHALRDTMTTVAVPPPMSEVVVLDAARLAQRHRRARWAGAGSAAAAVAVIGAAVVVVAATSGAGGSGAVQPGVAPSSTGSEQPSKTGTSWPNGQTDRTARSGPEFDKGEALLGELAGAVPPGYGAPDDLTYEDPDYSGGPLRFSQAQYEDTVGGTEVWEYLAQQPITEGNGVGQLFVEVTTPGNAMAGDGCALAPSLWGMAGTCEEHVVGGNAVGVFTPADRQDFHSWAGYRYDDGTVVFVAQSLDYPGSAKPPLAAAPLTARQLAELAADERFLLD